MEIGDSVIDSLREKLEKSVLISYTPISNSLWHSVWNSLIDPTLVVQMVHQVLREQDSLWESLNASARNSAWK